MLNFADLAKWLEPNAHKAVAILGGSATPALSLQSIVSLSSDPEKTKAAFDYNQIPLGLPPGQGKAELREVIASNYNQKLSGLEADDIIVANATTGANHIIHRSLLRPGDHVIVQYPTYGPLIEEPRHIGCDISYLPLDPANGWQPDLKELRSLVRPGVTKLLVLNNPSNPTGTHFTTETQREIVKIAQEHDFIIHCDEIFRPLFHPASPLPHSMIEHLDAFPDFHNIVTTSSLSKVYGLSGVRIGWIATRSPALLQKFIHLRLYSMEEASAVDEIIATEVLGPRCRPGILDLHYQLAKTNIDLIQAFVDRNKDTVEWVRPTAGAVGFVKVKNPKTGEGVDDVDFCQRLLDQKKVLLSPATMCFQISQKDEAIIDFGGRMRMHFTAPTESLKKGIALIEEFLAEQEW